MNIPQTKRPPLTHACLWRIYALTLVLVLASSGGLSAQNMQNQLIGTPTSLMENFSFPYLEKLVQIAKENYPRVRGYDTRIDIASTDVAKANINYIDILSFSFIYNPNYTFNILNPTYFQGIQVGISINMASFLQKPLNVRTAKLNRKTAQIDREEYLLTLENQVKTAYINYLQAQQIAILQTNALNNSRDVMTLTETRYRRSEVNYEAYSQSQTSYGASISGKLSAEATLLNTKFALELLLGGRKLEEIK